MQEQKRDDQKKKNSVTVFSHILHPLFLIKTHNPRYSLPHLKIYSLDVVKSPHYFDFYHSRIKGQKL